MCFGAAIPVSCGSIYKGFAQCLLTLGDSLVETEKDPNTQDIDAICRCVYVYLYVFACRSHWLSAALSLATFCLS